MPLTAYGFNGIGQIAPEPFIRTHLTTISNTNSLQLFSILPIAAYHDVKLAKWSFTIIQADSSLYFLGWSSDPNSKEAPADLNWYEIKSSSHLNWASLHLTFFGQDPERTGAFSSNGQLLSFSREALFCSLTLLHCSHENAGLTISAITTLENEKIAVAFVYTDAPDQCNIWQFANLDDVEHWYVTGKKSSVRERYQIRGHCASLVGGATAFALLTKDGEVYTWGLDYRAWELGRTPDESFPAEAPGLVEYLAGIRVNKIVAHMDLYGAITEYHDLYVWGSFSGEGSSLVKLDLSESLVNLVDIDRGVNVVDVGIGADFLVCISDDGQIYGIGRNENGQLLSGSLREIVPDWEKLADIKASRVVCGHWTTFIM